MNHRYAVTTMGALNPFNDDETHGGMLNERFTMASLRSLRGPDDGPAASEGGETTGTDVFQHVNPTATEIPDPSFVDTVFGPGISAAEKLKNLVTGGGGSHQTTPQRGGGGGGGGGGAGGGTLPNAQVAGVFGDLFGPSTDTIVLTAGLLAVAGIGWLLVSRAKTTGGGGAKGKRRR